MIEALEPEEDAERTAFYAAIEETTNLTGHRPAAFDIWLMARGLMNTSGRRVPTSEPPPVEAA